MAINRRTLRLLRQLRITVGSEADDAVRTLAKAWMDAWAGLANRWQVAADALITLAVQVDRWPAPVQIARIAGVDVALTATDAALAELGTQTTTVVTSGAATVVAATAAAEPAIIASQMPAAVVGEFTQRVASRILLTALDVITARTRQAIVAQTRPLSADAMEAVRRELIRGVQVGSNPNDAARRMVAAVNGAFEGGLTRATAIARTEMLDAYRVASRYTHEANADVLDGWVWLATVTGAGALRTCFPAGTLVTTLRGDVAIEDVVVGDDLLTHAGRWRRVYETLSRPYAGPMVTVEAGGLRVSATADHPFLVERQGELHWMEAQDVAVGDTVFSNRDSLDNGLSHSCGEVAVERCCDQTDDSESATAQECSLFGIPVGNLVMPVGFVHLKSDVQGRQKKINRPDPPGDGRLLNVLDTDLIERKPDISLGNGLSGVATVAAHRAEPAMTRRNDPDPLAARRTDDVHRWPPALFRAVFPVLARRAELRIATNTLARILGRWASALRRTEPSCTARLHNTEDGFAPHAGSLAGGGAGADGRAHDAAEPAGSNGEGFLTARADLYAAFDVVQAGPRAIFRLPVMPHPERVAASGAVAGSSGAGYTASRTSSVRVLSLSGGATAHAAKCSTALPDVGGGDTKTGLAMGADTLRPGVMLPLRTIGARTFDRAIFQPTVAAIEGGFATATSQFHRYIVSGVKSFDGSLTVYNVEVVEDHSYVANGFVVHNCPSCWAMHGTEHPLSEAGPLDHVQGRCARAPKAKSWKALGFDMDEPDDNIPDARALFAALPRDDQIRILGARRLAMMDAGDIDWVDIPARRDNDAWRPSYSPRPVRDLERIAARRRGDT